MTIPSHTLDLHHLFQSLPNHNLGIMKPQVCLLSLAASLLHIGFVSAGNNSPEPGTTGVHMTYDCEGDPMGCQNMCYYYYCLGRSNYMQVFRVESHTSCS